MHRQANTYAALFKKSELLFEPETSIQPLDINITFVTLNRFFAKL